MSQQKVDQYKKEKYGRKQQLKKEKRQHLIYTVTGSVAAIAIAGWIGFSIYARVEANRPVSYTEVSLDAINDYLSTQTQS